MRLMNQAEFAKQIGVTPSHVTQLKTAGRLVMQGAMVDVEASKALIADTQDPGKTGVSERHAQEREQKQSGQDLEALTGKAGSAYQQARAMKEKYNAMAAKLDYELAIGMVLIAADAKAAVADGDAIVRNRLEALPDMLAPQLAAENDEQKIRAMLMDQVEFLLSELSRTFYGIIK